MNQYVKFFREVRKSLLPYQDRWVSDKGRFRIANKARQTRLSTTIALEAMFALYNKTNSLVISASEKNAQEVLDKCYRWGRVFSQAGIPIKLPKEPPKTEFAFNDAKILSLAQNPDTVRGFAGDVYLDEFAHHSSDRAIYEAIFPAITAGYRISIISTPLGQSGLFYDIWSSGKYRDFTRHQTTILEAREQGLPVDIELLRRNMDEDSFRQEYLCEFIDEASAYYPYSLIRSNIGEPVTEGGELFLGVDLGRKKDLTVLYLLRQLGEKLYTQEIEELKNETFEVQRAAIRNKLLTQNVRRCRIDGTGLGMQLAEELKKEFYQVEPISFTAESKERMAVQVKRALELHNLQLPDNQKLIADIHAIKKQVTPSNNVRFDADRNEGGHADRFWALALGVDAAQQQSGLKILFSA